MFFLKRYFNVTLINTKLLVAVHGLKLEIINER